MKINFANIDTCAAASGVVVVIDVCRAFTTAPFALEAGAGRILLTSTVDEAFRLRDRFPEALLMGEEGGYPIRGFDFGNSPAQFEGVDLAGRTLIQRTSAGTQGVVRSANADVLLAASFACAGATAQAVRRMQPEEVTLVVTDERLPGQPDEDQACADYLAALLGGQAPDPAAYLGRVEGWPPAHQAHEAVTREAWDMDLQRCLLVDRFDFALHVERQDGLLVMTRFDPEGET